MESEEGLNLKEGLSSLKEFLIVSTLVGVTSLNFLIGSSVLEKMCYHNKSPEQIEEMIKKESNPIINNVVVNTLSIPGRYSSYLFYKGFEGLYNKIHNK